MTDSLWAKTKYLVRIQRGDNQGTWVMYDSSAGTTRYIKQIQRYASRYNKTSRKWEDTGESYSVIVYLVEFLLEECIDKPIAEPLIIYNGTTKDFPGFTKGKIKGT